MIRQKDDDFIFLVADGTAKLSVRNYEFREPTQRREPTVRSEDLSGELQGELGESQPTESKDDAEARKDFWSMQGDFICRHHNESRVQLYVPKEESFPVPLKYIDVTRATCTDLDVMEKKRVDDRQGEGVPKAGHQQAAAGPRGSRTCVCEHLGVWVAQGEKGELTSCRGTVQSAWSVPPVRCKEGRPKAGENGQNSGVMGDRPGQDRRLPGDTAKVSASSCSVFQKKKRVAPGPSSRSPAGRTLAKKDTVIPT